MMSTKKKKHKCISVYYKPGPFVSQLDCYPNGLTTP